MEVGSGARVVFVTNELNIRPMSVIWTVYPDLYLRPAEVITTDFHNQMQKKFPAIIYNIV